MIKLNRSLVPRPTSLNTNRASSSISKEIIRNQQIIAQHGQVDGAVLDFRAYSQPSVKKSIKDLSNERCAYCGNRGVRSNVQVEHYRPKQELMTISGLSVKPAYYWLGGEWSNLLPACEYCNNYKNAEIIEADEIVEKGFGKGTYFGILNENRTSPLINGSELTEFPLLYDPCTDDPLELFEYKKTTIDNEVYLVMIPNSNIVDQNKLQRAEHSIIRLGLNHPVLAKERLDMAVSCKQTMRLLEGMLANGASGATMKQNIVEIIKFVSKNKNSSFIGLCRRLSKECIFDVRNYLVQAGDIPIHQEMTSFEKAISDMELFCHGYNYATDLDDIF